MYVLTFIEKFLLLISSSTYTFSNEDREKLFSELNFDPETAAKEQAERMRTLPASYQLANVNVFIKNVSLTMVDVVESVVVGERSSERKKERKKEALLRLELPMMRSNVTVSFFVSYFSYILNNLLLVNIFLHVLTFIENNLIFSLFMFKVPNLV